MLAIPIISGLFLCFILGHYLGEHKADIVIDKIEDITMKFQNDEYSGKKAIALIREEIDKYDL